MTSKRATSRLAVVGRLAAALGLFLWTVALPIPAVKASAAPRPAATVAAGFSDSLAANVPLATGLVALPDGRVLVLAQSGEVRMVKPGFGLVAGNVASLNVCTIDERGLLGGTFDPAFGDNRFVYLFYTRPSAGAPSGCVNRISRFTMSGDTIPLATEKVLVDNISSVNGNHNAGTVAFGNDGFLYISTGDAGADPRNPANTGGSNDAAQDLSLLNGKMLRVNPTTGEGAPDNPIPSATSCRVRGNTPSTPNSPCAELFAWGLRNPFRFAMDPNSGPVRFFINDVGQNTREEVDAGAKAANYGWNIREGRCPQGQDPPCAGPPPALTDPIVDYGRTFGSFITAGAFVPNGAWPATYDGAYLFADGGSSKIWVKPASGSVSFGLPFATGTGVVADMAFVLEPTGYALYYTDVAAGQVRRIVWNGQGTTPTPAGLRYDSLPVQERVYDTRSAPSPGAGRIRNGSTRLVDLGDPGVDAKAALVNVTMTDAKGRGYIAAWAGRTSRVQSSIVNIPGPGAYAANTAIVPIAADGSIVVHSTATTHLVIDVLGYFRETGGSTTSGHVRSAGPERLVDTRMPSGAQNQYTETPGPPVFGATVDDLIMPVRGRAGVPVGATSAVVILTGVAGPAVTGPGFASAFASGIPRPLVSTLNTDGPGDVRANLTIVPLGADGSIHVYLRNIADALVDVVGYVADTASPSSGGLLTLIPTERFVDTRNGTGFDILDDGEVSVLDLNPPVPNGAAMVVQNLTMVRNAGPGYVVAAPDDGSPLTTSNVNAREPGQTRAAQAFTPLPPSGRVRYKAYSRTDLVVDLVGYFS